MTQILVTKPGVLNQRDRSALRKAGVVCVEAESPADVKLIEPHGELGGGDLLFAAMYGVNRSDLAKQDFAEAVLKLLVDARKEEPHA